jgi:GT2 family glycosyltransferase
MSSNNKFSFVILHYISIEDTDACIKSIKSNCRYTNYNIIVVDNKSPNGSGKKLFRKYEKYKNVTVILNRNNLGFARGNNIGIDFARKNYSPDFIIVLNNDVLLYQNNFTDQISNEYAQSNFSVLGPEIVGTDGEADRYSQELISIFELTKQIILNFLKIILLYLGLYMPYLSLRKKILSTKTNNHSSVKRNRKTNVVLQGSCLIFSKKIISQFNNVFDPRTFMYKEEQLLYISIKRRNLLSVYNPEIKVLHKAEASTKLAMGTEKRKLLFLYKNQLRSSRVLLPEIIKGF